MAEKRATSPVFSLHAAHRALRTADIIPHALAGDAKLFGNFGKRKILIIMQIIALALLFREKLPVKSSSILRISLPSSTGAPSCQVFYLCRVYTGLMPLSKYFLLSGGVAG